MGAQYKLFGEDALRAQPGACGGAWNWLVTSLSPPSSEWPERRSRRSPWPASKHDAWSAGVHQEAGRHQCRSTAPESAESTPAAPESLVPIRARRVRLEESDDLFSVACRSVRMQACCTVRLSPSGGSLRTLRIRRGSAKKSAPDALRASRRRRAWAWCVTLCR